MLCIGLFVPLALAAFLEPDSRGYGTHQHMGLPPCTFMVLFGRRCPSCGMTTSWTHLVRGQPVEALRANVGGTISGLLVLVAEPWLLLSVVRGRWLLWSPDSTTTAWVLTGIVAITLIDWSFRFLAG